MPAVEIHDFYPYPVRKRYGGIVPEHAGIRRVLDRGRESYVERLEAFARYNDHFHQIALDQADGARPHWNNGFFPFLDVVALFGLIAETKPRRYLEIGSGNSTKVARFARERLGLQFEIISIDPHPRAEIDALCDRTIRARLQDCDLQMFDELEPGDILFFDGSHRVLQNSDNQVLFFDILPRLSPGVLIHIHDINWPHDYPEEWNDRYYNEQYVLGAMLLYASSRMEVVFPGAYVTMHVPYERYFESIWKRGGFERMQKHGCSFWFRMNSEAEAIERIRP